MEAENYLSEGFALRAALERRENWAPLAKLARVWTPSRLKGIQVSRDYGTPFLAATQVYDVRPVPRKWLALERTADAADRFVQEGQILVTCSGSVGRPTLSTVAHAGVLISHDLLRVDVRDNRDRGWLYACLHAQQFRAMATGAKYGHMIKHLEPSHLEALPVPLIDDETAASFTKRVDAILEMRNSAHGLSIEAESEFEHAIGPLMPTDFGETGFGVSVSTIASGRRRFDASVYNPAVAAIRAHLRKKAVSSTTVHQAGFDVWLPGRFKRTPATDGVLLVESAALTEVNPDIDKCIAETDFGDEYKGRVHPGWLLLARSGQVYGILGTAVLASDAFDGYVVSDDVIRVAPNYRCKMRSGYLVVVLSHPSLGRPLVKALAYGSSIPHIDPTDFADLDIVRLIPKVEDLIADLAEAAAQLRARADVLEREVGEDADAIISAALA